jgi:TolB protein
MKANNSMTARAAIAASAIILGSTLISAVWAQAPSAAGAPHSIAFASTRDGNNEIFVMNPDGMGQESRTETTAPVSNLRPEVSPDGRSIVFSSNRDGNFEIFVTDGQNVRQLTVTAAPVANSWPRWSPDGEWIAYHSGSGTNFQIFRIRPDGSGLTQVTNYAGLNQFPNWSRDGARLVIRRDSDLFLIDSADGADPVRLTMQAGINQMASFSPDGSRIAFMSTRVGGTPSVFIMDASDGGNLVHLTPRPPDYPSTAVWTSRAPDWSPDGQYIYYTAARSVENTNSNEQIYVRPVSGGSEERLTSMGVNSEAAVRKVQAPTIAGLTATPDVIWTPNGEMVPVALIADVSDISDPSPVCRITDVTSNETAENAWEITGDLTLDLRAERLGRGSGRIYTITVTCTNTSQLSSSATVTVTVPHDQRKPR